MNKRTGLIFFFLGFLALVGCGFYQINQYEQQVEAKGAAQEQVTDIEQDLPQERSKQGPKSDI